MNLSSGCEIGESSKKTEALKPFIGYLETRVFWMLNEESRMED